MNSVSGKYEVLVDYVSDWLNSLDRELALDVYAAIKKLSCDGPHLGRPLVDRIKGSVFHNMKELRPLTRAGVEIRILFIFDPHRKAVLLVAGNKAEGKSHRIKWNGWYLRNIPVAERIYREHLKAGGGK